jgi:hypothetical protein
MYSKPKHAEDHRDTLVHKLTCKQYRTVNGCRDNGRLMSSHHFEIPVLRISSWIRILTCFIKTRRDADLEVTKFPDLWSRICPPIICWCSHMCLCPTRFTTPPPRCPHTSQRMGEVAFVLGTQGVVLRRNSRATCSKTGAHFAAC